MQGFGFITPLRSTRRAARTVISRFEPWITEHDRTVAAGKNGYRGLNYERYRGLDVDSVVGLGLISNLPSSHRRLCSCASLSPQQDSRLMRLRDLSRVGSLARVRMSQQTKFSPPGRISCLRIVLSFLYVVILCRQVAAGESPAHSSGFASTHLPTDVLASSPLSFSRALSQEEVNFSPNIPAGALSGHLDKYAAN